MSYVRANTAPPFGMRSQALSPMASRLGYYFRSGFPLPTTSMSRPLRLGSAFWDGPDNVYPQPELSRTRATATQLNGEWVPPQPPTRALFQQGAVTYRINPANGQYEFRSTDMTPRGLWQQNTFQHPVRSALSSLGVPVATRGTTLVQHHGRNVVMHTTPRGRITQGRQSHDPIVKLKAALAGMFSGPGCAGGCGCGGSCGKHLGDDEPCGIDDAGNVMMCPVANTTGGGGGTSTWDGSANPPFTPPATGIPGLQNGPPLVNGVLPGTAGGSILQQVANGINTVLNPHPVVQPATLTPASWFSGSTAIGGVSVPNMLLAGGLVIAGLSLGSGGSRGRR
jgi:hypothetical protein